MITDNICISGNINLDFNLLLAGLILIELGSDNQNDKLSILLNIKTFEYTVMSIQCVYKFTFIFGTLVDIFPNDILIK